MDIITTDERLLEHLAKIFPQYTFSHKFLNIAKEAIRAWEEHDPRRQIELPDFMTCYSINDPANIVEKQTGTAHQLCKFLKLSDFLTDEDCFTINKKYKNGEYEK